MFYVGFNVAYPIIYVNNEYVHQNGLQGGYGARKQSFARISARTAGQVKVRALSTVNFMLEKFPRKPQKTRNGA